jgi:hypothetical protein
MKTNWRLLVVCGTAALLAGADAAPAADAVPAIIPAISGHLRVVQHTPCNGLVDLTTPVTGGRIDLLPAEGVDVSDDKFFALTRVTVRIDDFSAHAECLGIGETHTYTDIGAELAAPVSFTAASRGGGRYAYSIPASAVRIYTTGRFNGALQRSLQRPSERVTGSINLATGAFSMRVVTSQTVHFRGACVGDVCAIDENDDGTMTLDLHGTIPLPDADGDGAPDRGDNCPLVANPDQTPVPTPTIDAPDNVTLSSCVNHTIGSATATDVCDGGPLTVTNDAPGAFTVGANTVTWTATDTKTRAASDTQTVTIVDTTKPAFAFVPLDVSAGNCGPVSLGTAMATDDCAGTPAIANDAPASFFVGTTVVTWTATDASGNVTTTPQNVVVTDTVLPTVSCTAVNPPLGNSFVVTGADACGAPVLTLGSYVIANGEQIKIEETGQPGVRLQNGIASGGIRQFQVGRGQGVIVAGDGSGNTATAVCR